MPDCNRTKSRHQRRKRMGKGQRARSIGLKKVALPRVAMKEHNQKGTKTTITAMEWIRLPSPRIPEKKVITFSSRGSEKMGMSLSGSLVTRVLPNSLAESKGVVSGWRILEVSGYQVPDDAGAVAKAISSLQGQLSRFSVTFGLPPRAQFVLAVGDSTGCLSLVDADTAQQLHDPQPPLYGAKIKQIKVYYKPVAKRGVKLGDAANSNEGVGGNTGNLSNTYEGYQVWMTRNAQIVVLFGDGSIAVVNSLCVQEIADRLSMSSRGSSGGGSSSSSGSSSRQKSRRIGIPSHHHQHHKAEIARQQPQVKTGAAWEWKFTLYRQSRGAKVNAICVTKLPARCPPGFFFRDKMGDYNRKEMQMFTTGDSPFLALHALTERGLVAQMDGHVRRQGTTRKLVSMVGDVLSGFLRSIEHTDEEALPTLSQSPKTPVGNSENLSLTPKHSSDSKLEIVPEVAAARRTILIMTL